MKRTVALLLVVVLVAVLFVGCSPAGEYHVKTIDGKKPMEYFDKIIKEESDGEMDLEEYIEKYDADEDDFKDPMVLELKKNGKFTMTISLFGEESEMEGTWKKDGNSILLKTEDEDDEDALELTVKGGKLILEEEFLSDDDVEIVFGKGK